jgi:hypothetical protein
MPDTGNAPDRPVFLTTNSASPKRNPATEGGCRGRADDGSRRGSNARALVDRAYCAALPRLTKAWAKMEEVPNLV